MYENRGQDAVEHKLRAAIYARLSEEDRDKTDSSADSESIMNQVMLLKRYAVANGWDVYECYTDDDWAGADRSRPSFNRLLRDAEQGKFDIVLCKTQSRFTRELELVEKYIHGLFPIWGIRFIGVVDNADTNVKGNKKSRQINGLVNEWYLEDMSDNIRAVLTARRREGYYIGSTPLYGYKKDPERKGHLIIDPEAAEIVRLVFHLFADGTGKTAIARMLNERGIPNPTEYKRQKGILHKVPDHKIGTLWKYYTIAGMLANEMYIGNLIQGKYGSASYKTKKNKPIPKEQWIRVEQTHEAIIDIELWDTVQKMLKERAKPFVTGAVGLFSKKVRCRHCGAVMRSGKGRGKHYLRCATRYVAKDACIGSFIFVDKLEQIVRMEFQKIHEQYSDEASLQNEIENRDSLSGEIAKSEYRCRQQEKKMVQLNKAIKNLYLDKAKGEISEKLFHEVFHELQSDKEKIEEQWRVFCKATEMLKSQLKESSGKKEIIREYVDAKRLSRSMVEQFIDYIEISKRNPVTQIAEVQIHWNF